MGEGEHFVQFWETDDELVHSVGGYVGSSLARGDAAVAIATPPHARAIEQALARHGIDVTAAEVEGRYVVLDANEVVAKLMFGGLPDEGRFDAVVGSVVARSSSEGRHVRVFGEAVAILLAAGQRAAAVRFEDLWNDLGRRHAFSLFCAYPLGMGLDGAAVGTVCRQHRGIIPGESFASLDDAADRMRAVVSLQQRVRALEAEVRRRAETERALLQRLLDVQD